MEGGKSKTQVKEEVMKIPRNAVTAVVVAVLECPELKRATKFLDAKTIVRCTRPKRCYGYERWDNVVLTVGRPNHAERKFIRDCQRNHVEGQMKHLQLKWWPKQKKGA